MEIKAPATLGDTYMSLSLIIILSKDNIQLAHCTCFSEELELEIYFYSQASLQKITLLRRYGNAPPQLFVAFLLKATKIHFVSTPGLGGPNLSEFQSHMRTPKLKSAYMIEIRLG